MCRPKSSRFTVFLLFEPNREAQQQLRNAVPSEAAGMETEGISREGTASQALWEPSQVPAVPHTASPSRQPGGNPTREGGGALRGATRADTTAGPLSATDPHGDTK